MRSIIKLASFEKNITVLVQLEVPVLQRLLQLLLVPDEEIVMNVMVFNYLSLGISIPLHKRFPRLWITSSNLSQIQRTLS